MSTEAPAAVSAPAPSTESTGTSVPSWARRVMSSFPLWEWPVAEVPTCTSLSATQTLDKIKLYVAPGHPALLPPGRQGNKSRRNGTAKKTWASADPRCLRWQTALILAQVPFEVQHIDPLDAWGPSDGASPYSVPGTLPYLELPPLERRPRHMPSSIAAGLVSEKELPTWLGTLSDPAQGSAQGQGSDVQTDLLEAEAQVWISLLETKLMAGVLLQRHDVLRLEWQPESVPETDEGVLHTYVRSHVRKSYLNAEAKRIHGLSPASSAGSWGSESFGVSPTPAKSPTGIKWVLSTVQAFFSHVSIGMEGSEAPTSGPGAPSDYPTAAHPGHLDSAAVYDAATVALNSFVSRIASGPGIDSSAERPQGTQEVLQSLPLLRMDASPTQRNLASLVFALLHNLLSYPYDERMREPTSNRERDEFLRNATLGQWRRTVLDCTVMSQWLRTFYSTYIVPRESK